MPRVSSLARQRTKIKSSFDKAPKKVFNSLELAAFVDKNRDAWELPASMRWRQVAEFFASSGELIPIELRRASVGKNLSGPAVIRRYSWGKSSPFSVALSLRPNSYLSHASAVF